MNENTNGLIRQYFTKGSSFEHITENQIEDVMQKLKDMVKNKNFEAVNKIV
ncbi:MAG: hypothetical protein HOP02_10930 [Methylococcaceae bacterium]|nr:hypothetical protein [Methylococcaceae bacterium]